MGHETDPSLVLDEAIEDLKRISGDFDEVKQIIEASLTDSAFLEYSDRDISALEDITEQVGKLALGFGVLKKELKVTRETDDDEIPDTSSWHKGIIDANQIPEVREPDDRDPIDLVIASDRQIIVNGKRYSFTEDSPKIFVMNLLMSRRHRATSLREAEAYGFYSSTLNDQRNASRWNYHINGLIEDLDKIAGNKDEPLDVIKVVGGSVSTGLYYRLNSAILINDKRDTKNSEFGKPDTSTWYKELLAAEDIPKIEDSSTKPSDSLKLISPTEIKINGKVYQLVGNQLYIFNLLLSRLNQVTVWEDSVDYGFRNDEPDPELHRRKWRAAIVKMIRKFNTEELDIIELASDHPTWGKGYRINPKVKVLDQRINPDDPFANMDPFQRCMAIQRAVKEFVLSGEGDELPPVKTPADRKAIRLGLQSVTDEVKIDKKDVGLKMRWDTVQSMIANVEDSNETLTRIHKQYGGEV